ncbi:S8 family peptidase [Streptomyces sp. NPDC059575]|uniref:S8 family peptidase n=1 Tax=Streptomyces sp. NPDC059575 TaxID=3346872 RepID=UPI0036788BB3
MVDRSADRPQHAARLAQELVSVQQNAHAADTSLPPELRADGFAVRIEAAPAHELKLESLDNSGLSLMSVRPGTQASPQDAVVWVPDGAVGALLKKIDEFTGNTRTGKPKNNELVANIEQIEQATIKNLWQEEEPLPGLDTEAWWELWLDRTLTEADQVASLRNLADAHGWQMLPRAISIGQFHVAQVSTTARELARVLRTNACPSEIRKPTFTEELHSRGLRELHRDFVHDLAARLRPAAPGAPTVTLLDTGIDQEHPLLRACIIGAHSVITGEGADDNAGHGTQMGGLALFGGAFEQALDSRATLQLDHHLESVKILPRAKSQPRPHGEVTAVAVSTAETAAPEHPRARVFTMAVTVESGEGINGTDGTATLWSASLDALAAGTDVAVTHDQLNLIGPPESDLSRLIVVSAGNIRDHQPTDLIDIDGNLDHLDLCDSSRIEDPAQAWNVLTVGAYTELNHVPTDSDHYGYRPVAASGLLSPHSRTSVMFPDATPIKPDIVMEGGNLLIDEDRTWVVGHDAVNLTTTDRTYHGRLLTSMSATSPATAQAARLAALAHARYPKLRPETVRGLLVHEAEWTDAMLEGVYNRNGRRKITAQKLARTLLRRYGWGVPSEESVLASTASAVTMIIQDRLIPFRREARSVRLGELKLHELPWPREQLLDLDATEVKLRVTLSYFIEPNPGRRGRLGQHTYASHRLRFALKGPNESVEAFEQRIAENAQAEDDARTTGRPFDTDKDWLIGRTNRDRGSLHADIWRGTARELADCGVLAVFPAGGWWKYHNSSDRVGRAVPYALLVSLKTPDVTADLYTPTAVQLGLPVPTEISSFTQTGVPVDMRLF